MEPLDEVIPPVSRQVIQSRYCYLQSQVKRTTGLVVHAAGWEACGPEYLIDRATFPSLAIEFILAGRGELTLDHQTHELYPGLMFCYGPGVAYQMKADPGDPMKKYFLDFSGGEAKTILEQATWKPGQLRQVLDLQVFHNLFDLLLDLGTRIAPSLEMAQAQAADLTRVLLRQASQSIEPAGQADISGRLRDWLGHIDRHAQRLCSLQEVADELSVSGEYLCRIFRRFDLPSPFQYLTQRKLERAAELLLQGFSVKMVSVKLGYADPFHFSRLFKRHIGRSPSDYASQGRKIGIG